MATKTNATPQKEEVPKNEGPETPPDSPPLNLSDATVKKLIRSAKLGYVAHDQINSVLPSEKVNSEQIEGVLADETEVIDRTSGGSATARTSRRSQRCGTKGVRSWS